jgi:hypothetical protein
MKIITIDGVPYRLPGGLNPFQMHMYVHLIDWKWQHITRQPGEKGGHLYDAILPESCRDHYPMLYPGIIPAFQAHLVRFPFRIHTFFNHMASSQAANINLFLPILLHPAANAVLGALKLDFAALATSELDHGYRIEFWDAPFGSLNDKNDVSGTDADLAIAYTNQQGEACLWLIEHKLTEAEFTTCGGYRSPGRQPQHDCGRSYSEILADKSACYYHDRRKFRYWEVTQANRDFFVHHAQYPHCPFQGGMNQLWRNQLLGLSIEQDARQPFQRVYFSVVKHPKNTSLDGTLGAYRALIAGDPRFSVLTSEAVVTAAEQHGDAALRQWAGWYRGLYEV